MLLAACSGLFHEYLACVGVFARSTRSSALSVSVLVSAIHRLLLVVWNHFLDLFTSIVRNLDRLWIEMVLTCPAIMSKRSVSPSAERTIASVFLSSIISTVPVSLGRPCTRSIFLCVESNALEKYSNKSVALRFFVRTPSMIRQKVRIWELSVYNFCSLGLIIQRNPISGVQKQNKKYAKLKSKRWLRF